MRARDTYEIVRLLGEGGWGRVYEAVHQPSGQRVALKTAAPWVGESAGLRRALLDEATAVARLRHANVVALLDVGRDERHAPFLVMEYVEGHDLSRWIDFWPGWPAVFAAMRDALHALAAAHAAGIVHADVKPENLLRTRGGIVKLTDFGVARVRDPLLADEGVRGIAGTPVYMAPEQLRGASLGPATDLYSLGVVLHELLCGELPWPESQDLDALKSWRLSPRALSPREGVELPDALRSLVARLLAPEPRARPRFAREVLDELERLGPSVIDRAEPTAPRASPPGAASERTEVKVSTVRSAFGPDDRAALDDDAALAGWLVRLRPPPLLGREQETAIIRDLVDRVLTERRARLCLLVGPAGMGKSRLAEWGFASVDANGLMERCAARFDPSGHDHSRGVRHALKQLLGAPPFDWLAVDGALPFDAVLTARFLEGAPLSLDETVETSIAALAAVCRLRPLYVWLDDIGWAYDGTVEVVERVLRDEDLPILFVGTVRSGTADHPRVAARLSALRELDATSVHELRPLDAVARCQLATSLVPLAPGLAETIAAALPDTPLVLVHFVQGWVAGGFLVPGGRGWGPRDGRMVDEETIRDGAATVFADRLDRVLTELGPAREEGESILIRAALIGDRVGAAELRTAIEGSGIALSVDELLDRVLLDGVVRAHEGVYAFEHARYREVLLSRLSARADRDKILREAAETLLRVSDTQAPEAALRIATLLRDAGLAAQGATALRRVATHCLNIGEVAICESLLAVVERWATSDPANLDLQFEHASGLMLLRYHRSEYDSARRCAEKVMELARLLQRPAEAARARLVLAGIAYYTGDHVVAEHFVAVAEREAVPEHDRVDLEFAIADMRARLALRRRDYDAAVHFWERASEHASAISRRAVAAATLGLAAVHITRGDQPTARSCVQRAKALATAQRDAGLLARTAVVETWLDVASGDFASARARMRPLSRAFASDAWRQTELRLLSAIVSAELDTTPRARAATRRFARAFQRVPHEESTSRWGATLLADRLHARGLDEEANVVEALSSGSVVRMTDPDFTRPAS